MTSVPAARSQAWADPVGFPCQQGKNVVEPPKGTLEAPKICLRSRVWVRFGRAGRQRNFGAEKAVDSGLTAEFGTRSLACLFSIKSHLRIDDIPLPPMYGGDRACARGGRRRSARHGRRF